MLHIKDSLSNVINLPPKKIVTLLTMNALFLLRNILLDLMSQPLGRINTAAVCLKQCGCIEGDDYFTNV